MPAFGDILERTEIALLVDHVQSLPEGADPLAGEGGALFDQNCASCHGVDAKGNRDLGAPNLTDAIWLYASDGASLTTLISEAPFGVMPPWQDRLGQHGVRALAAYVHQLGGGEDPAEE